MSGGQKATLDGTVKKMYIADARRQWSEGEVIVLSLNHMNEDIADPLSQEVEETQPLTAVVWLMVS